MWNEVSKHNYITNIHSIETQNKIREYINTSHQDPNNARDELLNIITDVATKSVPLKDIVHRECSESELKHLSKENKETLESAKQKYTRDRKAYVKEKQNNNRRIEYIKSRRYYKKKKYYMLNTSKSNRILKLAE